MLRRSRHHRIALAIVLSLASPAAAFAQTAPTEKSEQLSTEAKRLAAEGKYADACPMFEESQRLEPAIGTQLDLADCYEKTGRAATALALFHEVVRIAQLSGKAERQDAAEERVAALEHAVPRIRVTPPSSPTAAELATRIDGKLIDRDILTRGLAVDPGEHVVKVDATGYQSWTTTATVAPAGGDAGRVFEIVVPALQPVAPVLVAPVEPPAAPYSPPSKLRPIGFAMMGVGAIGIGAGVIFGFSAISRRNQAGCDGNDCSGAPIGSGDTLRDAQSSATASTICFIGGGLLAAGGVALFVLAPRGSTTRASARMTPGGGAMTLEHAF